jgi:hypothetical protein
MAAFSAQWEVPEEGSEGGEEGGTGDASGCTYSYGYEGATAAWPSPSLEDATRRAQAMAQAGGAGDPWVVTEYPPGGGPGRTVAIYRNGRLVPPASTGNALSEITSLTPIRCQVHGTTCTWAEYADGTGEHRVPREGSEGSGGEGTSPSSSTTEGTPMASEVTYDGVKRRMASATTAAEDRLAQAVNTVTAAQEGAESASSGKAWAGQSADQMQALGVDPDTLGAMADHLDAVDAADKAHQGLLEAAVAVRAAQQRVIETAGTVDATLSRLHGGLNEAHQNAPVDAADKAFYEEG